eukprot:COSAG04_NODE_364_length_15834_cov_4.430315_13_plen_264_part_00
MIPDWEPVHFTADQIPMERFPFLPDNAATRRDLAKMYTAANRMDQGLALVLDELEKAGAASETLVISFSDNGVAFPRAKTTLFESGQGEPLVIYDPTQASSVRETTPRRCDALVSSLDFFPTALDVFGIPLASGYGPPDPLPPFSGSIGFVHCANDSIANTSCGFTGVSLLPLLRTEPIPSATNHVFGSHTLHEIDQYFPMRSVRSDTHRLIVNLASPLERPILSDVFCKMLTPSRRATLNFALSVSLTARHHFRHRHLVPDP